uniref:Beta-ketoacyl-[acyl-carrier-protein] synthase II/polyketide synthase n=1 Tax=Rathayibacter sp. FH 236 TaxID=2615183 RepID=A0A5J6SGL4_9MICO|nr:beta-ketoacyl-[acyl-carrier-protein] synthase II/polyketide synthase [Rathayibacter sp. FH 236]
MTASRRVAVVGMGTKSPAGLSVGAAVETLRDGRGFAKRVGILVDAQSSVQIACVVEEYDLTPYLSTPFHRRNNRAALLALSAATDAYRDSGLLGEEEERRTAVFVGTASGGLSIVDELTSAALEGRRALSPFTTTKIMANSAAALISVRLGIRGSADTFVTACASGSTALGEAYRRIRDGYADVALAGGVDAPVTPIIVEGFARTGALSLGREDVASTSRPFSIDRDGFVLGEGATFVVLEEWESARARGVRIVGEVLGYAANSDAFHVVKPLADGSMAGKCMSEAIADARLTTADIGHINAHGTGTILNDDAERCAIARIFGRRIPVVAHKGVTGHMLGGSGAFEAALGIACTRNGFLPPIANLTPHQDELVDLVDAERPVRAESVFLSNSFGFGGHNTVLVLRSVA